MGPAPLTHDNLALTPQQQNGAVAKNAAQTNDGAVVADRDAGEAESEGGADEADTDDDEVAAFFNAFGLTAFSGVEVWRGREERR